MATFICNNCKDQMQISLPTSPDDISGLKAEALLLDSDLTRILDTGSATNSSAQVAQLARLFELVSGETEIDYPLCHDCTLSFARKLDRLVRAAVW